MPSRTWIESGIPSAALPDSSALSSLFISFCLVLFFSLSFFEIEMGYSMRVVRTTEIKIPEKKKKEEEERERRA